VTDAKRKMHLAVQAAAPEHPAGWRVPGGERQANEDVAHYQNVARICERALLDVLFLADSPSFTDDGRSPTRSLDPVVLITACALATEHLGLVLTASTTLSEEAALRAAGAVACLTKDSQLDEIVAAILDAAARAPA